MTLALAIAIATVKRASRIILRAHRRYPIGWTECKPLLMGQFFAIVGAVFAYHLIKNDIENAVATLPPEAVLCAISRCF
jgi:hypothetical protein